MKKRLYGKKFRHKMSWFDSTILQTCLGFGSFGLVFKAVDDTSTQTKSDLQLQQCSAVKIIFLENNADDEEDDDRDHDLDKEEVRISREYELLKGKTHPHIVSAQHLIQKCFSPGELVDIFSNVSSPTIEDERQYLMMRAYYLDRVHEFGQVRAFCLKMELCGETLRDWLKCQCHPDKKRVEGKLWDKSFLTVQAAIVQGLLDGMKFLHRNKIIHRDFKPENVMFSGIGYILPVKIGDFGLSRQIHTEQSCTGILTINQGTMAYRAPEMNSHTYAEPADLYALGLVLLEVLQLVPHSERNTLFDKIVNDNETDLILEHCLIPNAKQVVIRLTRKKTSDRFSSIEDVFMPTSDFLNVSSASQLAQCFAHCHDGDHILIHSGVYSGTFILREKNNIVLKGVESGNVLIRNESHNLTSSTLAVLQVIGNSCLIRDISIDSTQVHWGLSVTGDSNSVKNLEIKDSQNAVTIHGANNSVTNLVIKSATWNGLSIHGNCNRVKNLSCASGYAGVNIHGSQNQFSAIVVTAKSTNLDMGYSGVRHGTGNQNEVDGLTCHISKRPFSEWGFSCFSTKANYFILRNVVCHYILINGFGHKLENVVCKKVLRVYGWGHVLNSVSGDRLEVLEHGQSGGGSSINSSMGTVNVVKCKFKRTIFSRNNDAKCLKCRGCGSSPKIGLFSGKDPTPCKQCPFQFSGSLIAWGSRVGAKAGWHSRPIE
ncbi:uncharacterized protein LOC118436153 [Folsomia candida]|uniref:uncharacterized protein LOC118436153 n=1 Tax=Folsomia candida TaxID=158441 RepID=UPI001605582D|nr:uncharacterized protein LOC118436153 [Folsomia candida]